MDIPPPNPRSLLDHWMEWERGDLAPGELMKQLKMGGMRTLLEAMISEQEAGTTETLGDLLDQ